MKPNDHVLSTSVDLNLRGNIDVSVTAFSDRTIFSDGNTTPITSTNSSTTITNLPSSLSAQDLNDNPSLRGSTDSGINVQVNGDSAGTGHVILRATYFTAFSLDKDFEAP